MAGFSSAKGMLIRQSIMYWTGTAMKTILLTILLIVFHAHVMTGQNDEIPVVTTELTSNLYKIQIYSTSVLALVGPQGILLTDTGYEQTGERLLEELRTISDQDILAIIYTHWHYDHTGGAKVIGRGKTIIGHNNVRTALQTDQTVDGTLVEAYPAHAWPNVTYPGNAATFMFQDKEIQLIPFPVGHTDGDLAVYYKDANILYIGDLVFSDCFPYLDRSRGGNAMKYADNVQRIIDRMPRDVRIIAAHGREVSINDLKTYHDMLMKTIAIVKQHVGQGKNLEQMQKEQVLKDWAEQWGQGFIDADTWIELVHSSIMMGED